MKTLESLATCENLFEKIKETGRYINIITIDRKEYSERMEKILNDRDELPDDNSYRCAQCNEVFQRTRTDEEAGAEAESIFGHINKPVVVCDDCWQVLIPQELKNRST